METKFYMPQLFRDHFQNFKSYNIPRAQLIVADGTDRP